MNNNKEENNKETHTPIGALGVIILLGIIVALPLAISILDIGTPIKGFSGFKNK